MKEILSFAVLLPNVLKNKTPEGVLDNNIMEY